MKYLRLKINVATFVVCLVVWVALGLAMAWPGYTLPLELKTLFATITGVIINTLTGFEKGADDENKIPAVPDVAGP